MSRTFTYKVRVLMVQQPCLRQYSAEKRSGWSEADNESDEGINHHNLERFVQKGVLEQAQFRRRTQINIVLVVVARSGHSAVMNELLELVPDLLGLRPSSQPAQ